MEPAGTGDGDIPAHFSTALDRGLRILDCVATVTRARVEEIAARVELPVSTVYRYVRQLKASGYLFEVDGFYSVGARFAGGESRRDTAHLVALAEPTLLRLRDVTRHTALLSVRVGSTLLCLDRVEPRRPTRLTFRRGSVQALYAGCSGQVLLAHAPKDVVDEVLAGPLRQLTARTPDRGALRTRLASIRERGYAISKGEINADAVGVAAPVLRGSQCVCVISVAGAAVTLAGDRLREALRAVTSAAVELGTVLEGTTVDTAWSSPAGG